MTVLSDFAEYIFIQVTQTANEITREILDWRPVNESNSIHKILTHLTRIAYLLIPQVINGTHNPSGWDDNYEKEEHSLDELRSDLNMAMENVVSLIKGLNEEELERKVLIWGKMRPLKEPVFALLSELMHHNGQIAMLRGIHKRTSL